MYVWFSADSPRVGAVTMKNISCNVSSPILYFGPKKSEWFHVIKHSIDLTHCIFENHVIIEKWEIFWFLSGNEQSPDYQWIFMAIAFPSQFKLCLQMAWQWGKRQRHETWFAISSTLFSCITCVSWKLLSDTLYLYCQALLQL